MTTRLANGRTRFLPFERIYLVYDNDKQGDEGAAEVVRRLGYHRCWRVRLPKKDANECLVSGVQRAEIAAAIDSAEHLERTANMQSRRRITTKGRTTLPYSDCLKSPRSKVQQLQ
jgi:hypothetical protein